MTSSGVFRLPPHIRRVLPAATAETWARILPLVPAAAYLAGGTGIAVQLFHRKSRDLDFFLEARVDLIELAQQLHEAGDFVPSLLQDDTLNGVFDACKLQFLLADTQRVIEPFVQIAGLRVAGLGDLLATKLKVIADRGALRDYFDIMILEQQAGRTVEEGLALAIARYHPEVPDQMVTSIVRGLGYFGDVADDPGLPASRRVIERYWRRRQPEIVRRLDRYSGQE
jgi:hypothetical protein